MAEYTPNLNLYKPNRLDSEEVDVTLSANFTKIDEALAENTKKTNSWIDVTQAPYNAKGDGITDDTIAIRNAINAVPQHGKLIFPNGVFRITDTLTNLDAGKGKLKAFDWIGSSSGSFIYIDIMDTTKDGLVIKKVNETNIENLTIIGKANCCKSAVILENFQRSEVKNLTVLAGAVNYGVEIRQSWINNINIKIPNSLVTGTEQTDLASISGKWIAPTNGVYFSELNAARLDLLIEGLNGEGLVSDNAINSSLNIYVQGTIEGIKKHGLLLSYITNLTIENLYEEANGASLSLGQFGDVLSNCTNVIIKNLNRHSGEIKYINCSNVDSDLIDHRYVVAGGTDFDDSTVSQLTTVEMEANTTLVEPMRSVRNKPIFLTYPLIDRINASNQPIENLKFSNNAFITGTILTDDKLIGTKNSFLAPETNYKNIMVGMDLTGLKGRTIYATIIFKKGSNANLVNPYYDFAFFLNGGAPVRSKTVYLSEIEANWNRVTIGLKLHASDLTNCSFRVRGYPSDSVNFLGIQIGYLALTVDKPSYSPFDFEGNVIRKPFKIERGLKVEDGTAAPTTGDYIKGDKIVNTSPTAGGKMGWVCTASGTPGTWKGYGTIDA